MAPSAASTSTYTHCFAGFAGFTCLTYWTQAAFRKTQWVGREEGRKGERQTPERKRDRKGRRERREKYIGGRVGEPVGWAGSSVPSTAVSETLA